MAMNFNRPASQPAAPIETAVKSTDMVEVQPYDIVADRESTSKALAHSPEVEALTAMINVNDPDTILTFGAQSAEEISKVSDVVLRSMSMEQVNDTGKLLNALAKIMDEFDIDEIREHPGLFSKIFGNMRKKLDAILAKYHTMGDEVDKIYVQRKQYETEIKHTNQKLEQMFQSNVNYYHDLVKYIVAGEQGCQEIADYIAERQAEFERTGDSSIQFELQSLQQAQMMLEQRTQDLRTAENVAMQSIPMLKTMEFSNMNLIRKINSAFIITLPVFKQALAQAMMLKRQKIQAEAISALDEKTNELLLKNARNTVEQAKITTRLAAGSSIKADTLETTWRTIMDGIEETRRIQEDASKQREADKQKLERIKQEFQSKYAIPQKR